MNANLAKIFIYPIKSLDGIALDRVKILKSGAIAKDRQWALIDEKGRFVNGKSNSKIHLLRSHFDLKFKTITLQIEGQEEKYHFNLETEKIALESWLSKYFNLKVKLVENDLTGFPDDTKANGPTIISTETIKEIAAWYSNISVEEMRSRLRANLEIDGVPAFWEDRLFDREDMPKKFQIGTVLFNGINPCQRCIVPTRNSQTGLAYKNFQKIFIERRKKTLPNWVNRDRFNHFYRIAVNTIVPSSEAGKTLQIGDKIIR